MAERPFTIRAHSVSEAKSYRFVFERPEAWAIFTINDATCELLMTSDYGSYAHRWPNAFGGATLTEFLAGKGRSQYDCHYIVGKFASSTRSHELDDVIDEDATTQELKRVICRRRRAREISAEVAREAWDEGISEWVSTGYSWHALPHELSEAVGEAVYHCIRKGKSAYYEVLADELLPFFCRWLRENVVSKGELEAAHG